MKRFPQKVYLAIVLGELDGLLEGLLEGRVIFLHRLEGVQLDDGARVGDETLMERSDKDLLNLHHVLAAGVVLELDDRTNASAGELEVDIGHTGEDLAVVEVSVLVAFGVGVQGDLGVGNVRHLLVPLLVRLAVRLDVLAAVNREGGP